jgi:hypothetical protein
MPLNGLGDVLRSRGGHEHAGVAYEEALRIFTALDPRGQPPPGTPQNLAYAALSGGDPDVEVTRVYGTEQGCCADSFSPQATAFQAFDAVGSRFVSAFVRATKPASS